MNNKTIYVDADWSAGIGPTRMGVLYAEVLRGKEVFSFEVDREWLTSGQQAMIIDPDISWFSGRQYLADRRVNYGMFMDSSPDRWGRMLMRRREAALAKREGRATQPIFESDYLLGVSDAHRTGAIRFKLDENGPYWADDPAASTPLVRSLRELEQLSLKIEDDDAIHDPEYLAWVNALIGSGSTLGGARPKVSAVDVDGSLWIAKFPSRMDEFDQGAWELLTYELAKEAGIRMAPCKVIRLSGAHHTFLTRRFDRGVNGSRVHFASAMTMLGYVDMQQGASYLEIAEFISRYGCQVDRDLEELWRRLVFSICVSNTDDHLRNHGFVLQPQGWVLSPAYDLNPNEQGQGLTLNITEDDNALDLTLALGVAKYFRLTERRAQQVLQEVQTAISQWDQRAERLGISRSDRMLKSNAFRVTNR
jgi:serine/threonine-protein kinase HipA